MMKSVIWWRKPEYPEETTDLRQVTDENPINSFNSFPRTRKLFVLFGNILHWKGALYLNALWLSGRHQSSRCAWRRFNPSSRYATCACVGATRPPEHQSWSSRPYTAPAEGLDSFEHFVCTCFGIRKRPLSTGSQLLSSGRLACDWSDSAEVRGEGSKFEQRSWNQMCDPHFNITDV